MPHTRRDFIRLSCCSAATLSTLAGLGRFGMMSALAAGPTCTGYKALVCIFLFGGNDSNNLIVPIDSRFTTYQNARGANQAMGGLALAQNTLVTLGSGTYGMHPSARELAGHYNSNNLAVLANVGTLIKPFISKTDYINRTIQAPDNLFSHSDQRDQWQTVQLSGVPTTGWAGRMRPSRAERFQPWSSARASARRSSSADPDAGLGNCSGSAREQHHSKYDRTEQVSGWRAEECAFIYHGIPGDSHRKSAQASRANHFRAELARRESTGLFLLPRRV